MTDITKPPLYRRRLVLLLTAAIVVVVVAVGLVLGLSGSSKQAVIGQFSLTGTSSYSTTGSACTGTGDYAAVKTGATVTLYGVESSYLGYGALTAGKVSAGSCVFTFDFGKVSGASEYTVVVAGKFRATKSKADLKAVGYAFDLSAGS